MARRTMRAASSGEASSASATKMASSASAPAPEPSELAGQAKPMSAVETLLEAKEKGELRVSDKLAQEIQEELTRPGSSRFALAWSVTTGKTIRSK